MDFPYLEFTLDLPNMYIQTNVCYINGKKDEEFLGFNVLDYGKRLGIPQKEKKIIWKKYIKYGQFFTSTLSINWSPISACEISSPLELQILIVQVGAGPVLAIVPAVVRVDTLNPIFKFCSPVL